MEKRFGNSFLGKSHFSYRKNVFGINFAILSDWSVKCSRKKNQKTFHRRASAGAQGERLQAL